MPAKPEARDPRPAIGAGALLLVAAAALAMTRSVVLAWVVGGLLLGLLARSLAYVLAARGAGSDPEEPAPRGALPRPSPPAPDRL